MRGVGAGKKHQVEGQKMQQLLICCDKQTVTNEPFLLREKKKRSDLTKKKRFANKVSPKSFPVKLTVCTFCNSINNEVARLIITYYILHLAIKLI